MRIMNINIHFVNFSTDSSDQRERVFATVRKHRSGQWPSRPGYTLVEMLLSVVLTLMLMYGVAEIFSMVGNSVNDSRALLGIGDRLRATQARLQLDLDGVTSHMTPPAKPENNEGYFELIEGPVGPTLPLISTATITSRVRNTDETTVVDDTTAIDYDDVLMFTTRTTTNEPFIGRVIQVDNTGTKRPVPTTVESRFAEVAWFVRGRTLYRRVKIIKPDFDFDPATPAQETLGCQYLYGTDLTVNLNDITTGTLGGNSGSWGVYIDTSTNKEQASFENLFDLSVRLQGTQGTPATYEWALNSLSDLTKRENRFYHAPIDLATVMFGARFPFMQYNTRLWQILKLPTLGETSHLDWMVYQWNCVNNIEGPQLPTVNATNPPTLTPDSFDIDFWNEPNPYDEVNPITGNLTAYEGPRVGEDVILNNVIGFDVKVWDPEAPVIAVGTNVLKPGDPGFPTSYIILATGQLRDLVNSTSYNIVSRGAYVDLGHNYRPEILEAKGAISPPANSIVRTSTFSGQPEAKSQFPTPDLSSVSNCVDPPATAPPFIYDTWSTHYEFDGLDEDGDGFPDVGNNGLDDGSGVAGLVDDPAELDTMPPYPVPLQAIQIKIRVFEPESQQVREVTIVHKF